MSLVVPIRIRKLAEQVASIIRAEAGPNVEVYWFGSWPCGKATPRSDLDMGIMAEKPLDPLLREQLTAAIDLLPTLHSIDLVDLRTVDDRFRARVLAEGVML